MTADAIASELEGRRRRLALGLRYAHLVEPGLMEDMSYMAHLRSTSPVPEPRRPRQRIAQIDLTYRPLREVTFAKMRWKTPIINQPPANQPSIKSS